MGDDELSLQEAKRLYELTIELLNAVSDFVIFEEFKKVFDERPSLINDLLPGAFTLDWILSDYKPPGIENNSFGSDVRRGLIDAMRRGEEHLDLSKKRGRGMRIMQNCLNLGTSRAASDEERLDLDDAKADADAAGVQFLTSSTAGSNDTSRGRGRSTVSLARLSRASLPHISGTSRGTRKDTPRLSSKGHAGASAFSLHGPHVGGKDAARSAEASADKRRLEEDEDMNSDESDLDDADYPSGRDAHGHALIGHSVHSVSASAGNARGHSGAVSAGIGKANLPPEALELPHLEVLPLNHTHAMRFRTMTLDAKTQQAYLRDKKDVNRSLRYQCLVCAVNHDFRLSKFAASAEHQH